eukprot:g1834.t1
MDAEGGGEQQLEHTPEPQPPIERAPRLSFFEGVICVLKANVGPGVLYLPRACQNAGCLVFLLFVGVFAQVTIVCILWLVEARNKIAPSCGAGTTCNSSYGSLFGKAVGSAVIGCGFVNVSICLCQFALNVTYYIVTTNLLRAFVFTPATDTATTSPSTPVATSSTVSVLALFVAIYCFVTPLTWIRSVGKLSVFLLLANICIGSGLLLLFVTELMDLDAVGKILWKTEGSTEPTPASGGTNEKSTSAPTDPNEQLLLLSSSFSLQNSLVALGTVCFAFEGICCVLPTFDAMERREDFPAVVRVGVSLTALIFAVAGVLGYAAFGAETKDIVLLNLVRNRNGEEGGDHHHARAGAAGGGNRSIMATSFDAIPTVIAVLYCLGILFTYPFEMLPAVRILEEYLFVPSKEKSQQQSSAIADPPRRLFYAPMGGQPHPAEDGTSPAAGDADFNDPERTANLNLILLPLHVKARKAVFRSVLSVCFLLIAYSLYDKFENFVSLSGSFCGVPLAFIYPALCRWGTRGSAHPTAAELLVLLTGGATFVAASYVNVKAVFFSPEQYRR